jgi:dienelactone hydrolase
MALSREPIQTKNVNVLAFGIVVFAVLAVAFGPATEAGSARRTTGRTLRLPALPGPDRVGTLALRLVDDSRSDPSFRSGHRELMVQLWYPAAAGGNGDAPYLPLAVARAIEREAHLPAGTVSRIRTHARVGAPVATGEHPVLLYSPGSGEMRSDATALVENLASDGFVIVTIDHTHEGELIRFPNGQLVRGTFVDTGPASNERALRTRVADTRFVLDQLARLDARGVFAGRLDLHRVGMFGFSLGGATAAASMLADARLKAGADLDGSLYGPVVQKGVRRPFLLMLSPIPPSFKQRCGARCAHLTEFHFFRSFYSHLRGPRYAVELAHSGHESFEDSVWIKSQLAPIDPAAAKLFDVGSIDARTAVSTVSSYLTAFFDRYLRGAEAPALDDPAKTYPALRPLH